MHETWSLKGFLVGFERLESSKGILDGKYLATPLLIGRGSLATATAMIECRKAKIEVGEGVTRLISGVKETDIGLYGLPFARRMAIARDVKLNPFKDVLVFRKMVEFLEAIPINLKTNMWESEELIEKRIDWNRPPKERDDA
ncbi:hypothetical protein Tco_0516453 [Tanacetum coccineum]